MDLRFGDYRLKRQERQLVGPDGPVDIGARSIDILLTLLDRPNEIVDKESLFKAAWPGLVVEENTLQVHVSALRKAVDPNFIVTVHGRGYKYAGPTPSQVGAENLATAEGPARKPVIVVLPFDNLSGDPEQQYFSDGISTDIADRLTLFRNFAVIGQHSAAAFRGAVPDFAAIREKLQADFVVTGSVRRADDRVRIAVRLSDAKTQEAIWADRHDRSIADLFALQDEISELVTAALRSHLVVQILVQNTRRSHSNLSSYEHFLQGYWNFRKLTREGNLAARASFEKAIAIDPNNAEAMAWLGVTYCEHWAQEFKSEYAEKGAELTTQAIATDPRNATAYAIHIWAMLCLGDRAGALKAGERAIALNPGDTAVLVNRALALAYDGRTAEARSLITTAQRLEPLPPPWFGEFAGVVAFAEGRYEETLAGVENLSTLAWDAMYALSCYGHLGDADKARSLLTRLRSEGRDMDWDLGLSRECYRDQEVSDRLSRGLKTALSL